MFLYFHLVASLPMVKISLFFFSWARLPVCPARLSLGVSVELPRGEIYSFTDLTRGALAGAAAAAVVVVDVVVVVTFGSVFVHVMITHEYYNTAEPDFNSHTRVEWDK
ncbi:uncharacterized protein B0I36DRAFT_72561 [Microdochium trichocladiopsis]|uniref:Uncharacterized protein n=1 Tax=Microdochium trichocladiopsis TaxID=1682393 RepID=A0A9P8YEC3_9PEZI|nr:uncharacterized protein B0I36DRAFT_72561 [Microdochium trichocladiopsis]KAH7037895.1 hypothetical protein B0I36DRAFT_72561 [Microdochium trichocladiopsis]